MAFMRQALVLLTCSLGGWTARADVVCSPEKLMAWPAPREGLPVNGRVTLAGWGRDRDLVAKIEDHRPTLNCGGDPVPLKVGARYEVADEAQVVLVPSSELRAGAQCRLSLSKVGADLSSFSWSILKKADRERPVWVGAPQVIETRRPCDHDDDCEFPVSVRVRVPLRQANDSLVLVQVAASGQRIGRYLFEPVGGVIQIQGRLCSGELEMRPGGRYSATLTAVDSGGNESPAAGPALEIQIPQRTGPRERRSD
jgi:hypothetical protein